MGKLTRISTCQCGAVQCEAIGRPIISGICYCDDCRAGAAVVEKLDGAPTIRTDDGGTHYLTFRDDRFTCTQGTEKLIPIKRSANASTARMVASCCNTAMYLKFAKGHWTSAYAARFQGKIPNVEMRTQVQFRTAVTPLPTDVPSHQGFGIALFYRLIASRIAMLFS
jgi:hypothetical protein